MIGLLFDLLFGCWHRRRSFPRTVRPGTRIAAAAVTGTYVVCLDCGRELPYDWATMRVLRRTVQASAEQRFQEAYER